MNPTRTVRLAYGRGVLDVGLPESATDVIEPVSVPGLKDEKESFLQSLDHPIESRPLREYLFPMRRFALFSLTLRERLRTSGLFPGC